MPFSDLFPFRERRSQRRANYAIGHSAPGMTSPTSSGPAKPDAPAGTRAQYRLARTSMPVPGLPDEVRVGRVLIHQTDGPIWTQRTHVLQKPGWRPTFLKHMDQGALEVARGYRLTVCTIDVVVPDDLVVAFRQWKDEA